MDKEQLASQALGLRETAESMIKAGEANKSVEASVRGTVAALAQATKQLHPDNPVVASLNVAAGITWSEVLTIANAVYKGA
jgi:hypothetical protein